MNWTETIEHVSSVEKKIEVSIPKQSIDEAYSKELKKAASKAQIKGFRPGKAPQKIIEQMYGPQARYQAVTQLVDNSFQETVKKNQFSVVGSPKVDFDEAATEEVVKYTATFFVYPKVDVQNYDSFEVTSEKKSVKEEDVDKVIEGILKNKSTVKKVDDRTTIEAKDIVAGEVEIKVEGDSSETRPEPLIGQLGDGYIPEPLEKALVGAALDTEITIEATIPESHREEALRGKKATYKATIRNIYTAELPALTDEFVESIGGAPKTVQELKDTVKFDLQNQYEEQEGLDIEKNIVIELLKRNSFEVPTVLIDDEIKNLAVKRGLTQEKNPANIEVEPLREQVGAEAEERVRAAIILDSLAEKEKLHAVMEDVEKHFDELSEKLQISIDEVRKFFAKDNRYLDLFVDQTRQKTLKFLRDRTTINSK